MKLEPFANTARFAAASFIAMGIAVLAIGASSYPWPDVTKSDRLPSPDSCDTPAVGAAPCLSPTPSASKVEVYHVVPGLSIVESSRV